MQCACAVLCCHLWAARLYHIFPHYLIKGTIFGGKRSWTQNECLDFVHNGVSSTSRSKKNQARTGQARHYHTCMSVGLHAKCRNSYHILMKREFSRYIFEQGSNIKFMKIHPVGADLFHADRQTDMTELIVAYRNFANASKAPTSKLWQ
jgi:hypothetical protein